MLSSSNAAHTKATLPCKNSVVHPIRMECTTDNLRVTRSTSHGCENPFKSYRGKKSSICAGNTFERFDTFRDPEKFQEVKLITLRLASPDTIRRWAETRLPNGKVVGLVHNANTLHHNTLKPLKGGLFCERIFGPTKDFQCACGIQKEKNFSRTTATRLFCLKCDVEYTWSLKRRYQSGYIRLVSPIAHLWYVKETPSFIAVMLDMKRKTLDAIIYCSSTLTIDSSINQLKNNFLASQPSSNWKEIVSTVKNTEVTNSENSFEKSNLRLDDVTKKHEEKSDTVGEKEGLRPSFPFVSSFLSEAEKKRDPQSYFFSASSNMIYLRKLKKKEKKTIRSLNESNVVLFLKKQKESVSTNKASEDQHLRLHKILSSKSLSSVGNQGALLLCHNQSNNYSNLNSFLNWTNLWTIAYKTAKKKIKMEYLSNLTVSFFLKNVRFSKNLLLSHKPLRQKDFLLALYAQKTSKLFKNSPKFSYGLKSLPLPASSNMKDWRKLPKQKSKNLSKTLKNLKKITKTKFLTAKSLFLSDLASFSPVIPFSVLTVDKKRDKFDRFIIKNNRLYLSLTTFPVFLHMIMYLFQKCEKTGKIGNSFSSLVRKKNILLYSLILKLKYTIKYWSIFKNFLFFQSILIKNNYSLKYASKFGNIKKQKYLSHPVVSLFFSEDKKRAKSNLRDPHRIKKSGHSHKFFLWKKKEVQTRDKASSVWLNHRFKTEAQSNYKYFKNGSVRALQKLQYCYPFLNLFKREEKVSFWLNEYQFLYGNKLLIVEKGLLMLKYFTKISNFHSHLLSHKELGYSKSVDLLEMEGKEGRSPDGWLKRSSLGLTSLNQGRQKTNLIHRFFDKKLSSVKPSYIRLIKNQFKKSVFNRDFYFSLCVKIFQQLHVYKTNYKNLVGKEGNSPFVSPLFLIGDSEMGSKNSLDMGQNANPLTPSLTNYSSIFFLDSWRVFEHERREIVPLARLNRFKREPFYSENKKKELKLRLSEHTKGGNISFENKLKISEKNIFLDSISDHLMLFVAKLNNSLVQILLENKFSSVMSFSTTIKNITSFNKTCYSRFFDGRVFENESRDYVPSLFGWISTKLTKENLSGLEIMQLYTSSSDVCSENFSFETASFPFQLGLFQKLIRFQKLTTNLRLLNTLFLKNHFIFLKRVKIIYNENYVFSSNLNPTKQVNLSKPLTPYLDKLIYVKFMEKGYLGSSVFVSFFLAKKFSFPKFSFPKFSFSKFSFPIKKRKLSLTDIAKLQKSERSLTKTKIRSNRKYLKKFGEYSLLKRAFLVKKQLALNFVHKVWKKYPGFLESIFSKWGKVETMSLLSFSNKNLKHYFSPLLSYQDSNLFVTSTSSKTVKNSTRLYNNVYVLSNRYCWDLDEDLQTFLHYLNEPTSPTDVCIPIYENRVLKYNFFRDPPPVLGGGLIQKLLSEFHPNECSKILMVLEKSLKTVNILLKSCDDFLEARTLRLKRNYILRRLKYIRSGSYKFTDDFLRFSLGKEGRSPDFHPTSTQKFLNTSTQSNKAFKLKNLRSFLKESRPEWMVLSLLPVLPPDLRPILQIGNQVAASDLNRLYQKVIYRNERLKRFLKDSTSTNSPQIKFAYRLLQEAVDNLIDNGKGKGTPETDNRGLPLKSLTELLKGKKGRFRQNLLGKRVDYSGRSVIVVGPRLRLHECGLPKEMAIELFLPFLIQKIFQSGKAATILGAKLLLKTDPTQTWEFLTMVMRENPVLLNRAPTLHRFGFQAFQPRLVEGKAILLHPLVCPAFNADFDGDQMAVHVPITAEAKVEAWKLMLARNHLLSSSTGEGMLLPSQDMVLGCYYLTATNPKLYKKTNFLKQYNYIFTSIEEVLQAYESQKINLHSFIWLRWNGKFQTNVNNEKLLELQVNTKGQIAKIFKNYVIYTDSSTFVQSIFVKTTPGRVLFYNYIFN